MRLISLKWFLHFTILAFLTFTLRLAYADTLETRLSEEQIALGESFTVSFLLNGTTNNISPDFSPIENNFTIISKNYGNAFNMLNGVTTVQKFWQLTLQPKKSGELFIPEIDFGSTHSTAQKIVVLERKQQSQNQNMEADTFVKAEVSNTTPYVQSEVLYTFKLFYQSQLTNPRIEIPQIKDATIVQLGSNKNYQTTIHGKTYYVAEKRFLFYPQKSGKLIIPATNFQALTYQLDYNSYNDRFYMASPKPISLTTNSFTLNVKKIPDTFQGSSWLPTKNLLLTEKWSMDPTQWELGNPVTRTITVEAQGLPADQIADLSIDKISGINIYIDSPKRKNRIEGHSVIGTMEQKITYIPNTLQSTLIPSLKLNWWNLTTNTNAVAQLQSMTVQAKGNMNKSSAIDDNSVRSLENPTHDDNSVRSLENPTHADQPAAKFFINLSNSSIWFWIAISLFALWLITLWIVWKRKSKTTVKLVDLKDQNNTVTKKNTVMDKPQFNEDNFKQTREQDNTTSKESFKQTLKKDNPTSEENFKKACEQGNATVAQQYLFSWAKHHWPDVSITLNNLSDLTHDEDFAQALKDLEQTIYANNLASWNGQALLAAYQRVKKQKNKSLHRHKMRNTETGQHDPLPPLNLNQ